MTALALQEKKKNEGKKEILIHFFHGFAQYLQRCTSAESKPHITAVPSPTQGFPWSRLQKRETKSRFSDQKTGVSTKAQRRHARGDLSSLLTSGPDQARPRAEAQSVISGSTPLASGKVIKTSRHYELRCWPLISVVWAPTLPYQLTSIASSCCGYRGYGKLLEATGNDKFPIPPPPPQLINVTNLLTSKLLKHQFSFTLNLYACQATICVEQCKGIPGLHLASGEM